MSLSLKLAKFTKKFSIKKTTEFYPFLFWRMQDTIFSAVVQCSTDENIFPNTVERNLCSWLYTPGEQTSRQLQGLCSNIWLGVCWLPFLIRVLVVAALQFTIRNGEAKVDIVSKR
jgi:hypothetical protein